MATGFLVTGNGTEVPFGMMTDPASVPIHLDKVMCTGDEGGIIDCYHYSGFAANCTHSNDTGILCSELT